MTATTATGTAVVLPFDLRHRPGLARATAMKIAIDWGLQWPLDLMLGDLAVSRTRAIAGNRGLAQAERDLRSALGHLVTALDRDVALRRDAAPAATLSVEDACDRLNLPWRLRAAVAALHDAVMADGRDVVRAHLERCRMMLEAELAQCQPGSRRVLEIED